MSVSRNATYNFLGSLVPSAVTLVTIPIYLQVLGVERYGLLTLCLVIVGYSQFLNNGMNLAVTRRIAQAPESHGPAIGGIVWTSIWLALGLGSFAALVIYVAARIYFSEFAVLDPVYAKEVADATLLVAMTVPLGTVVGALTGVLQGAERFLVLNAVQLIGSLLGFLPVALVYLFEPNLSLAIIGTIAGQLATVGLLCIALRSTVSVAKPIGPSRETAGGLLSFGARMALITIIVVAFNSVDRLVLGSLLSAAAVPAYAIAYGIVSRIIMVPHSLSAALFPRYAQADEHEVQRLASSSILAVASVTTPLIVGMILVVEVFFNLWIGRELSASAEPIAYALAGGFWFYCLSHMAYSMLQATGKETLVSKVLFAQLIPYCIMLAVCINSFGIIGAGVAFTVRSAVDCGLFFWLARMSGAALARLLPPLLLMTGATVTAAVLDGPERYAILSVLLIGAAIWSALNIPDMLRPYLGKLGGFLPRSGR